jgi:hypothetical protein
MGGEVMRELTQQEVDMVAGGGGEVCCCFPPPSVPGNPGNFKPVGNAGETPSNNPNFIFGGVFVPVLNGNRGNS